VCWRMWGRKGMGIRIKENRGLLYRVMLGEGGEHGREEKARESSVFYLSF